MVCMRSAETVVFIHGLGETPDAWDPQIAALPQGFSGIPIEVPGLSGRYPDGDRFTLAGAAAAVISELDRRGIDRAHLCGLSLGAMIAFETVRARPDRVRSLTLAAGQVRPPRALMAIQSLIMRMLPERVVASGGADKARMLAAVGAVADADFSADLAEVRVPTLVICGAKDRANLPAARAFAAGIPGARLSVIEGAGHQANSDEPERFSRVLGEFLERAAAQP